jgi:hypothetical protein
MTFDMGVLNGLTFRLLPMAKAALACIVGRSYLWPLPPPQVPGK